MSEPTTTCPNCNKPLTLHGDCEKWDIPEHKFAELWCCPKCDFAVWHVYRFMENIPDDHFESYQ